MLGDGARTPISPPGIRVAALTASVLIILFPVSDAMIMATISAVRAAPSPGTRGQAGPIAR